MSVKVRTGWSQLKAITMPVKKRGREPASSAQPYLRVFSIRNTTSLVAANIVPQTQNPLAYTGSFGSILFNTNHGSRRSDPTAIHGRSRKERRRCLVQTAGAHA